MVPHKHADFLLSLAKGEPTTNFEIKSVDGNEDEWIGRNNANHVAGLILFPEKWEVRRKTSTYTIGKHEVPSPMQSMPQPGSVYYVVDLLSADLYIDQTWDQDYAPHEQLWISRGLGHSTREAAILHAKALISLTSGEVE